MRVNRKQLHKAMAVSVILFVGNQSSFAYNHVASLKNLGSGEIMFAQLMIPHHQQAVEMANLALKNSNNMKVKLLAKNIITAQKSEMKQMKFWLKVTKSPETMGHQMEMNGMLTSQQFAQLGSLKGEKFDKLFLKLMIQHHEGALSMVSMVSKSKNGEVRKLAVAITNAQSSEISLMNGYLATK